MLVQYFPHLSRQSCKQYKLHNVLDNSAKKVMCLLEELKNNSMFSSFFFFLFVVLLSFENAHIKKTKQENTDMQAWSQNLLVCTFKDKSHRSILIILMVFH